VAALPAQAPGERVDRNPETVNVQTFARPPAPPTDHKPLDTLPTGVHAHHHDLAVAAAQLTPVALIGLQVEHATIWPMTARGFDPDFGGVHEARVGARDARPYDEFELYEDEDTDEEDTAAPESAPHDDAPQAAPAVEPDEPWCEALTHALRRALSAGVPPRALVAADEQWRRGRCVVLACPQGADPTAGAWAFVLWPRKDEPAADGTPSFGVRGTRVDARLQWSKPPAAGTWSATRVIKSHHPRTGRQLVPATPDATGCVPCEVQLGPVLARALRACDVCLKIGAARRVWSALGSQWSMLVVVSGAPLLDDGAVVEEVSR
jgi:hypothetical protein